MPLIETRNLKGALISNEKIIFNFRHEFMWGGIISARYPDGNFQYAVRDEGPKNVGKYRTRDIIWWSSA